jgi:acetylornithine deacetylase
VEREDDVRSAAGLGHAIGQALEGEAVRRVDQQQAVPGLDAELLGQRGSRVSGDCETLRRMRDDVIDLISRLVAIDSVNPALVPGGAGETEIARFVAAWAEANGLAAEWLEATPGRPSVVVRKRDAPDGKRLMLCAHLDTVGVEGMADPHTARLEGDRLHGRGAYDMKSGLASALIACREAPGDVIVAAVADEEHASLGVQEVLAAHSADAAIVTEPTERELIVAHKGFVWIEIEVEGRAAHGSRYEEGVDAIVRASPILTRLGELDASLGAHEHPLLGRGSVHASLIEGGAEMSSYPGRCTIGLERRTLPGDTQAQVEAEIGGILDGRGTQRTLLVREPFAIDPGAEIVRAVSDAAGAPKLAGAPYWADAAFIAAAGIPTVMFGAGGTGAHALEEWVSVDDSVAVTETLIAVAERICASN